MQKLQYKMTYYIFCASNESIPGILCISYFHPFNGSLKMALDFLNRKTPIFQIYLNRSEGEGKKTPYENYRQLPTPYNFVFIKKWGEGREGGERFHSDIWNIIREFKLSKLNIIDNDKNNLVGFGGNFYKNTIEEVKVLFDQIEGDYVDYLIEDALIIKEERRKIINDSIMKQRQDSINKKIEDIIINDHFKTLEDILEKKKGELERLDAILNERKAEIAELNKIIKYIKK